MSIRDSVARVIEHTKLSGLVFDIRRNLRAPLLTVVNYHRVHQPSAVSMVDEGVLDATPQSLDRQVAFIKRHFAIVDLDQVRAWQSGAALPPNPALITFDDGYLDCHERALPILRRHGVKATFFITTDYIERRRLFWWDKIAWIVKHTQQETIFLTHPSPVVLSMRQGVNHVINGLIRYVKLTFGLNVDRYIAELAVAARVPMSVELERSLADQLLMTWGHVRALRKAGMDIGSHTRTHRPLETLEFGVLRDELEGSKADLEDILQEPIDAISYPVGRPLAHKPILRQAVASSGYQLGFTHDTGVQYTLGYVDPLDIHRFAAARGAEETVFLASLALPPLGYTRAAED